MYKNNVIILKRENRLILGTQNLQECSLQSLQLKTVMEYA